MNPAGEVDHHHPGPGQGRPPPRAPFSLWADGSFVLGGSFGLYNHAPVTEQIANSVWPKLSRFHRFGFDLDSAFRPRSRDARLSLERVVLTGDDPPFLRLVIRRIR